MNVWITASSRVEDKKYLQLAKEVAQVFQERGDRLLIGGFESSMLQQIYESFSKVERIVTLPCYQEEVKKETELVDSTFTRTKMLFDLADIIVFLPGGTGTVAEMFASLEEYRTIDVRKQLILYNEEEFYTPLITFIQNLVTLGFNQKDILEKMDVVHSIDELKKKVRKLK